MRCDGAHDLEKDALSQREQEALEEMLRREVVRPAGFAEFLREEQEYRVYPAEYKRQVHWSITGACNLKCRHCFMSAPNAKHGSPTYEQIIRIADQLAECGIFQVAIQKSQLLNGGAQTKHIQISLLGLFSGGILRRRDSAADRYNRSACKLHALSSCFR